MYVYLVDAELGERGGVERVLRDGDHHSGVLTIHLLYQQLQHRLQKTNINLTSVLFKIIFCFWYNAEFCIYFFQYKVVILYKLLRRIVSKKNHTFKQQ